MFTPEIKFRADRAKNTFIKLAQRIDNMKPIFIDFIKYWQTDIMPATWASRGKMMEGQSWTAYSQRYAEWKKRNYGSKMPNLKVSGDLYNAVTGGTGWGEKVNKKTMTIEVGGKEYFWYVSERQTNPRKYFYTTENDLPARAWKWLIDRTNEHLESADDDR